MSNIVPEQEERDAQRGERQDGGRRTPSHRWLRRLRVLAGAFLVAVVVGAVAGLVVHSRSQSSASSSDARANPKLDPGIPASGRAANFMLTDQFGRSMSLHSFRGKVVILAFNDPVCTTVCPLTTTAMVEAKRLLGPAGAQVQLLGVGANPTATRVRSIRAYSQAHEMMHTWHFLTGPVGRLKRVWHAYGIEARVVHGQIDHTPAVFVIDRRSRLSRVYMTAMAYASVDQEAEHLAQSAAALLPGRPHVRSIGSLGETPTIGPGKPVTLPRWGGGTIRIGASATPHLILFFDTWDSETMNLGPQLQALNGYQSFAARHHLPPLIAVDEASVEPSAGALSRFLHRLRHPLSYPVALDRSGRVADGYGAQDSPWLTLISPSGKFLWYQDASTAGWPTRSRLIKHVRAALARPSG